MSALTFPRHYTVAGIDPFSQVEWETRVAEVGPFRQEGVEFPASWSQNATNITADKYFRGVQGTLDREYSVRQIISRLASWYTVKAGKDGYFASEEDANSFRSELIHLLLHQRGAFNSPSWFNVGRTGGLPPRVSACFTLSIEDSMESILEWSVIEGLVFKAGSGAGINISSLREEGAPLRDGGGASGPVSFMRGPDASAGTIKSGGATRRAAKLVVLNTDHPDIEQFISCKVHEEKKARVLKAAGFDVGLAGKDAFSIQYQNANNSVGCQEGFFPAVMEDKEWCLKSRIDGKVVKVLKARDLLRQIAQAAWECADPGILLLDNMNRWHTSPDSGYLDTCNPCIEFVRNNSSCNLASLRLTRYLKDCDFDAESFIWDVELLLTAMDASVSNAEYPTSKIKESVERYRELGLGYADLGALLMCLGVPYDSGQGRAWAAAITALMAGAAWRQSAKLAKALGPYPGWKVKENREAHLKVMGMHNDELFKVDWDYVPREIVDKAYHVWTEALELGRIYGYRNAQCTLLAPTGTISFLMDCDTTGIEPDFSLVKTKKLAGGGSMKIVNQCVPIALRNLGYSESAVKAITAHVEETGRFWSAPGFNNAEHGRVFDCAVGESAIHYMGHVTMMAACQPFLDGAISKTVNLPNFATVEDIEGLYQVAWRLGLKSIAVYRDGCKTDQPLNTTVSAPVVASAPLVSLTVPPTRKKLPRRRLGMTSSYRLGGCKGYVRTGCYPDGSLGEIFLTAAKQGSTLRGVLDAFAIAVSLGLQYGVPLSAFVEKFCGQSFPPAGVTNDPDVPIATSLVDYIFRRLAADHLTSELRIALNVQTAQEKIAKLDNQESKKEVDILPTLVSDFPLCLVCGVLMQRAGSCYVCADCGRTSGCS